MITVKPHRTELLGLHASVGGLAVFLDLFAIKELAKGDTSRRKRFIALLDPTRNGGASDKGTVFKLDTAGGETLLHSFRGGATDGALPMAGSVRDSAGNLYGTTSIGGAFGKGTIFKLSR